MRDYAMVSPKFWTRGSGKRLRGKPRGQLVAFHLMTCPAANMTGIYYQPIVTIAHELGMTLEDVRAGLAECEEAGFASYDEEHELTWVLNMAERNIGETLKPGDKRRAGVVAELAKIGSHRFVGQFYERYGAAYAMGLRSPLEGASGIMPEVGEDQDQDQDQDQEQPRARARGGSVVLERESGIVPAAAPAPPRPMLTPTDDGALGLTEPAYREGITSVTGRPIPRLPTPAIRSLLGLCEAFAPGVRGQALVDWVRATSADYARVADGTRRKFDRPDHMASWLSAGRPARDGPKAASPPSNRAWTAKGGIAE